MATGSVKTFDTQQAKELADVDAKLRDSAPRGSARMKLLRRQASLGDLRDAARDAERRRRAAER